MSEKWNISMAGRGVAPVPPAMGAHTDSDGHALHAPVLVLNASYEPINVCAARRAIVLVLKGVAMTEEENGHFLHAARIGFSHPSSNAWVEVRAPLPNDLRVYFEEVAGALGGRRAQTEAVLGRYRGWG